jgi:hypothetical protein
MSRSLRFVRSPFDSQAWSSRITQQAKWIRLTYYGSKGENGGVDQRIDDIYVCSGKETRKVKMR